MVRFYFMSSPKRIFVWFLQLSFVKGSFPSFYDDDKVRVVTSRLNIDCGIKSETDPHEEVNFTYDVLVSTTIIFRCNRGEREGLGGVWLRKVSQTGNPYPPRKVKNVPVSP